MKHYHYPAAAAWQRRREAAVVDDRHATLRGLLLMLLILLALLLVPPARGQGGPPVVGQPVSVSSGPPFDNMTRIKVISTNKLYECWTPNVNQPSFSWTIAGSTLTSIVDGTNTSTVTTASPHGLIPGNVVTISGEAGDTDLNGTYIIQTVGSSTTFTITTASVTDATYNTTGLEVATTAPRSTANIWAIEKFQYDGSNINTSEQWAIGAVVNKVLVPITRWRFACASAASYAYK